MTRVSSSDFTDRVRKGVLKPDGMYRGLTYGQYLCEWLRLFHSDTPSYRGYPGEIYYLFGNNSFITDTNTGSRRQLDTFQNNALNDDGTFRGQIIFQDTAIFVPVMNAFYSVGEMSLYDGYVLQTIADCQYVCRRDMNETPSLYCDLTSEDGETTDLFGDVLWIESPTFNLTVTENNPMRKRIEMPIDPGIYETFIAAYAIMLNTSSSSFLDEGHYRLRYGGIGRGSYINDSVQDFIVRSNHYLPRTLVQKQGGFIARQVARKISKQQPPPFKGVKQLNKSELLSIAKPINPNKTDNEE